MNLYLRVLRHPDFRYLFAGQAASVVGDQVVFVALALFITQRTGSPTDLGLVLGAQAITLLALILFGGVFADRLERRGIMIASDALRALLHALVAGLILSGAVAVWQLVVIEAAFGAAQAFFQPAYSGLLPQTVPEPLIQEARALTESVSNLAVLVGPAIATVLVLGVGAGEAFAFDAATFVVSALLLRRVTPRARGVASSPEPVLRSLHSGWREVRSRSWVWVTILAFSGAVLCVYAQWYSLAPVIARDVYGGARVFGVLESVAGLGAVCGALTALVWRPARPLRVGLLLVLAWPVQDAMFAVGAPLGMVCVGALATGCGFSLLMSPRLRVTSRRARYRASARGTGWARWHSCRSAMRSRARSRGSLALERCLGSDRCSGSSCWRVRCCPARRARWQANRAQPSSSRARSA